MALHYFIGPNEDNFIKIIDSLLLPGGKFSFVCFIGEAIVKLFNDKKNKPGEIYTNEKLSLNKEVDFDSILFNKSFLGNLTYTINLDEKKVKTSEISGWSKNYDILEVIENFSDRTKLLISCGDKKYLMLLEFGQNSLDYFYVERLLSVDNKRIGVYSDELTFITK